LNLAYFYRRYGRMESMEDAIRHASAAPMDQPEVLMESANMLLRSKRNLPQATQLLRRYLSSNLTVEAAPAFKAHYFLGTALEQGEGSSGSRISRLPCPGQELRPGSDRIGSAR
jgi:hypothetical protein